MSLAADEARQAPGFLVEMTGTGAKVSLFGDGKLVDFAESSDAAVVLFGRLTYRDDLAARLGPERTAGEAELVLAAWRRDGAAALETLEGDYAVVVVDRRNGKIEAARDPMGGYPVYWLDTPEGIALASSLRLLPGAEDRPVNPEFLSETMSLASGEIDYFAGTAFEGVTRLRGGERLTAGPGKTGVRVHSHWDWTAQVERPSSSRLDEAAEQYRERLTAAVRERLRGTVSAHVSGGMDSTAVALIAQDAMRSRGERLIGLSMIYDQIENLRAEAPFVQHGYDAAPDMIARRIDADDLLDFDSFQDCPPHDEPFSALFRIGLPKKTIEVALEDNADTLLTGFGADEVLSNAPYYIADLLRSGRVPEAWREAGRWSRARSCSIWRYLWPYGVSPLLPAGLGSGWRSLLRGGYADWLNQSDTTIAPFVQREFASRTGLHDRVLAHARSNFRSGSSVVLSESLSRLRTTSGDWLRHTLGSPRGLHMSHPFRDPRVMRLGMGARLAIPPDPGQQKPLLSAAMKDIVPEPILRRRSKTHFNAVYYKGLARNLPLLEEIASDPANDPLGLFDREELRRSLHRVALGVVAINGVTGLTNALSIMRWFSLLPQWRAAVPRPSREMSFSFGSN